MLAQTPQNGLSTIVYLVKLPAQEPWSSSYLGALPPKAHVDLFLSLRWNATSEGPFPVPSPPIYPLPQPLLRYYIVFGCFGIWNYLLDYSLFHLFPKTEAAQGAGARSVSLTPPAWNTDPQGAEWMWACREGTSDTTLIAAAQNIWTSAVRVLISACDHLFLNLQ